MSVEIFGEHISALQRLETRMGRLASVLSEIADALSGYPDGIEIKGAGLSLPATARIRLDAITVRAEEYPSIHEVQQMLAEWHNEMFRARRAWENLPGSARELLLPPGESPRQTVEPVV